MQPLALIAAHDLNRVIGKDNDLPWSYKDYPEDMKNFVRLTKGHTVIMGRKTCESFERGPLPKRRNIVISRSGFEREGFEVFSNLQEAIAAAYESDECPFIIGGGKIYELALPLITKMYLTEIQIESEGDTFFPEYDTSEWKETERNKDHEDLVIKTLERK